MSRFGSRVRGVTPVGEWLGGGGGGSIKSIQRGTIALSAATSATATITAVVLANSVLNFVGYDEIGASDNPATAAVRLALTNATTVTAFVNTSSSASVSFEVIEYYPGAIKSVQRGTIATVGTDTGTATISAVDMAKSSLSYLGMTTTFATGSSAGFIVCNLVFTNATTITANGLGGIDRTVGYQVVEWN